MKTRKIEGSSSGLSWVYWAPWYGSKMVWICAKTMISQRQPWRTFCPHKSIFLVHSLWSYNPHEQLSPHSRLRARTEPRQELVEGTLKKRYNPYTTRKDDVSFGGFHSYWQLQRLLQTMKAQGTTTLPQADFKQREYQESKRPKRRGRTCHCS